MGGSQPERKIQRPDLRASEVDTHARGRQVEVHFDKRMCRHEHRLVDPLDECRPHWLEGQDAEFFFQTETRPFRSHLEPFIVRMSCHEALPNRNMLP